MGFFSFLELMIWHGSKDTNQKNDITIWTVIPSKFKVNNRNGMAEKVVKYVNNKDTIMMSVIL